MSKVIYSLKDWFARNPRATLATIISVSVLIGFLIGIVVG